jgi:exodeoxyribonuclease V alpha subunit
MAILEGSLERITFRNDETGYTVARLQPAGKRHLVTVVGKLLDVQPGEALRLEGEWTTHATHGRQFVATSWQAVLPSDAEGIRKYLASGLIKGIGPKMAERIVGAFGAQTLQIIETSPQLLYDVPGLGRKKADAVVKAWGEQQGIKALMALLQNYGITTTLAIRIYRKYGENALDIVRDSPYRLADEVDGIGFLTADQVAHAQGVRHDDEFRIASGLRHILNEAAGDGHCYLPAEDLLDRTAALLAVDIARVRTTLRRLEAQGDVYENLRFDEVDGVSVIYLPEFFNAEIGVAGAIHAVQRTRSQIAPLFKRLKWAQVWERLARSHGRDLTEKQREAVQTVLTTKLCVLTGGPGTGKTTTLRAVIDLLEEQRCRYVLASPTGRAAKRLSEATGAEAKTIHRLLEYTPGAGGFGRSFKRNREYPLDADMIVIDEASMLDIFLCNDLLKAVPRDAHVLFVGDADQLPSVGPGNVLHDLINVPAVHSVHLDIIFRQAEGSGIISNAHRINAGEMPQLKGLNDFHFFRLPEPERCTDKVVELVGERISRVFDIDRRDIQVLSPMHRGISGVQELNKRLQEALNPPHPARPDYVWGDSTFRIGDRVMQVRNNYDLDVYNGDVGVISSIDRAEKTFTIRYDEVHGPRDVVYDFNLLDELQLAYAMSIHKAQGAEYPVVVVPLVRQHALLLQRNLLYTAVTRARKMVVLVGDDQAIRRAVENNTVARRNTGLQRRLESPRLSEDYGDYLSDVDSIPQD